MYNSSARHDDTKQHRQTSASSSLRRRAAATSAGAPSGTSRRISSSNSTPQQTLRRPSSSLLSHHNEMDSTRIENACAVAELLAKIDATLAAKVKDLPEVGVDRNLTTTATATATPPQQDTNNDIVEKEKEKEEDVVMMMACRSTFHGICSARRNNGDGSEKKENCHSSLDVRRTRATTAADPAQGCDVVVASGTSSAVRDDTTRNCAHRSQHGLDSLPDTLCGNNTHRPRNDLENMTSQNYTNNLPQKKEEETREETQQDHQHSNEYQNNIPPLPSTRPPLGTSDPNALHVMKVKPLRSIHDEEVAFGGRGGGSESDDEEDEGDVALRLALTQRFVRQ